MAEELRPEGIPVTVGEVVIVTPGLYRRGRVHAPGTPGMRGEEQATEDFRQALGRRRHGRAARRRLPAPGGHAR